MRAHGLATAGRRSSGRGLQAEGQHRPVHVRRSQRVERTPAGRRVGDDDREQGVAQRCFHRRLPPVVDLDQVEQRAHRAVDAGEMIGPGLGAGGLEREVQRLGARLPA